MERIDVNKMSESDICGGPLACVNRRYDKSKKDCQECATEASQAIQQADEELRKEYDSKVH